MASKIAAAVLFWVGGVLVGSGYVELVRLTPTSILPVFVQMGSGLLLTLSGMVMMRSQ